MLPDSLKDINEEEGVVLLSINSVMRIIYSYFGVILFVSLVLFALGWVADFLESDAFTDIEEIATFIAGLIRALTYGIGGTVFIAIFIKILADTWGSMAYNKSLNQDAALAHFKNSQPNHNDTDPEIGREETPPTPAANSHQAMVAVSGPSGSPPTATVISEPPAPTGPTGPPAPPPNQVHQNSQVESAASDIQPSAQPNSRKRLFQLIQSQGHNIGEYSFFDERMNTDEGRRLFYNHAIKNNMPVGTWESFEQKMKQ